MLKRFSKVTVSLICISMLISQTAYLAPITDNSQSQVQSSKQVETQLDTPIVSTIPKANVYIPAGTELDVVLKSQVSSKTNKVGETIDFETAENLIINDVIVIPKGTVGKAVISEARKAGGMGRKGKLAIQAVSICTKNGVEVPLTSAVKGTGKTDGGAAVVFAAVSIVGGLFMKGTNITYPAGTHFSVAIKNDTDLGVTNENLSETMEKNQPQGKKIVITR